MSQQPHTLTKEQARMIGEIAREYPGTKYIKAAGLLQVPLAERGYGTLSMAYPVSQLFNVDYIRISVELAKGLAQLNLQRQERFDV